MDQLVDQSSMNPWVSDMTPADVHTDLNEVVMDESS